MPIATASPPPGPFDALGISEVACRWRCSVSTIRRKIARGLLPTITLPGSNRPLVPADAVAEAERARVRTLDQPDAPTLDASTVSFV